MLEEYIKSEFYNIRDLMAEMAQNQRITAQITSIAEQSVTCLKNGGKIMLYGIGALQIASLLMGRINYDRPALPAMVLTNELGGYSHDKALSRQVEAIGKEGDILIILSTSGCDKNMIEAVKSARVKNITTIGFLARHGKDIGALVDYAVNIPHDEDARIHQGHICCGNIISTLIEETIFGQKFNPARKPEADPLVTKKIAEAVFA